MCSSAGPGVRLPGVSTPPDEPLVPPSGPERASSDPWQPPHPELPPPQPLAHPTPAGQPPAFEYGAPPWPQQRPAWGAAQQYGGTASEPAVRKARAALGWAVGAAVGALLALGFALLAVVATVGSGSSADTSEDTVYEPLRDQLEEFEDGDALPGPILVGRLRNLLADEGVSLRDIAISCPDTASVTASTVVVCYGEVDALQWTGVVFFEGREGSFVVLET